MCPSNVLGVLKNEDVPFWSHANNSVPKIEVWRSLHGTPCMIIYSSDVEHYYTFFLISKKWHKLTTNQLWRSAQTRTSIGRWRPEQRSPRCGAPSRRGRTLSLLTETSKPASLKPKQRPHTGKIKQGKSETKTLAICRKKISGAPTRRSRLDRGPYETGGPPFSAEPRDGAGRTCPRGGPRRGPPCTYHVLSVATPQSSVWIEDNN